MKSNSSLRKIAVIISSFLLTFAFVTTATSQQNDQTEANKQQSETKKEPINPNADVKDGWRISDYKPYISSLKDLETLSQEYSEFLLKRAIDEYAKGLDTLDDMETEVTRLKENYKNKKYLNEKWYWQEVDRKNAQDRYINRLRIEAKTKAVTYFTKAINTLDEIRSNELMNNEKYLTFKSRLFRIYVSTQYDIGNFKPCIPILERYVTLTDENRKDLWAYKYMSNCYAFMETLLDKTGKSSEEDVVYYKNKKNQALLKAVEIQYGLDSPEFKELQLIVQLDEKKSESINVNK
ncbi:MAG TPA: hypothetical protein PKX79_07835 [Spirochaetota bacterium]|jgi:hypothetical protein|nr:hypothetical protein [Spirochaetota bacterium]OQA96146.1 MAG: hypothetical protein BWY23_02159 [Spirochaetes bacterium ADurb.Bin218]HOK02535.1 hypothetical protein [Spirochaetota bacterium]HOK92491.1 hypothetical protein [Spirochaetota bacterium]HON15486.1 hypothetical protein [Spirochaetota bacterium]